MSRVLSFPTVVYRWLPGKSLGPSLTVQQLAALLESYHRMHALCRRDYADSDLPDAWFHWFDFAPYLAELSGLLAGYGPWLAATALDGRDLHDRLARLVDGCAEALTTAAVDPGRGRFPLRLCHVDPNLANAIWVRMAGCAGWIGSTAAGATPRWTWRSCAGTRRWPG